MTDLPESGRLRFTLSSCTGVAPTKHDERSGLNGMIASS